MAESRTGPPKLRLFVSYAHQDAGDLAGRLEGDLTLRGYDTWRDRKRITGGAAWSREIEHAIDGAGAVLALLSRASVESDICRGEHLRALRLKKRVVPLLVQQDADRPVYLEAAHYILFDSLAPDEYAASSGALLAAIERGESASLAGPYLAKRIRPPEERYRTVPPLPRTFVPRPAELERLVQAVINDRSDRRIAITAVRAMGGIGKTVLAQALCYSDAAGDAFPDGVVWATIGEHPSESRVIGQMREIARFLEDDLARYDTIEGCKNQFATTVGQGGKSLLIVLDDVGDVRDIAPFIASAPRSRLLVTTRRGEVARGTEARELALDVPDAGQAEALLSGRNGIPVSEFPPEAADVIEECGRLPLALALIGAFVRGGGDRWRRALHALRNADLEKIGVQFPDYRHPNLLKAIQVSVEWLSLEARSRYLDFAGRRGKQSPCHWLR